MEGAKKIILGRNVGERERKVQSIPVSTVSMHECIHMYMHLYIDACVYTIICTCMTFMQVCIYV